jgi:DNA-binding response OmpR family regulator
MSVVLVIEDDPAILCGLNDNLKCEGYDVITAADGESGYQLARREKPDLLILDLMLPEMGGYEVCRKLRADGIAVPILILSARGEEANRVLGLNLGADDYVTKPFSVLELMARVRALLRRAQQQPRSQPEEIRFGDVFVDFKRFETTKKGRPVELTRKEFAILRLLAGTLGEVVTREELLNEVWGYESYPTTRTVDTHMASIRAKLEANPAAPRHLMTMHGVGYKLVL